VDLGLGVKPAFQIRTLVCRVSKVFGSSESLKTDIEPETLAEFKSRSTAVRLPREESNLLKLKVEFVPVRVGVCAVVVIVDCATAPPVANTLPATIMRRRFFIFGILVG
jgi:hypothetical protein